MQLSSKLFTAELYESIRDLDQERGILEINDGERLSHLMYADDVVLIAEDTDK